MFTILSANNFIFFKQQKIRYFYEVVVAGRVLYNMSRVHLENEFCST